MTLISYLESLPQYNELEESIARSRVLNPSTIAWDQDSYDWNENQTIHNYSYDWNDIS